MKEGEPKFEEEKQEDLELKEERVKNRQMYMITETFKCRENPNERIKNWILSLGPYVLGSELVDEKNLAELLRPLALLEDIDEATQKVYIVLKPFYDLKSRPEVMALHSDHISVNEVCNYEISKDGTRIELHLPPTGVKEVMILYKTGLRELASIIKGMPVTEIFVDSWIVKRIPKKVEEWRFTVKDGEGKRPWSRTATISKEKFLEIYGREEK